MKYWYCKVYTPFFGEEADVYIMARDEEYARIKGNDAAQENGLEWYDEEDWLERQDFDKDADDYEDMQDEYFAQCGISLLIEITEEEYVQKKMEGEWTV